MMFGGEYEKKETDFKPLEKGRYTCVLDNVCIEQTPTTKTNFLKMDFTIVKGDMANRKIWHKMWFTKDAYNMAAQQLDNMGVFDKIKPTADIEGFMKSAAEAVFELVSSKMEVSVTGHNEHNGKKYENTFITGHGDSVSVIVGQKGVINENEEIAF